MKILAFSGSGGTGKTFGALDLVKRLEEDGFVVHHGYICEKNKESINRQVKEMGFPINENTNFEAQSKIMEMYLEGDKETREIAEPADFIIYDRTPFDHLAYSKRALSFTEYDKIFDMTRAHMKKYPLDKCFWMSPLSDGIKADGGRSTNKDFQTEIHNIFEDIFTSPPNKQIIESTTLCQITRQDLKERLDYPYKITTMLK